MQAIAIIGCFFYIDRSRKVPPTFFIGEPQGLPLLYNKTEKECKMVIVHTVPSWCFGCLVTPFYHRVLYELFYFPKLLLLIV